MSPGALAASAASSAGGCRRSTPGRWWSTKTRRCSGRGSSTASCRATRRSRGCRAAARLRITTRGRASRGFAKVVAQVRDELCVGRMVSGFDADDPWLQALFVFLHVPEKVKLRLRRSHDEDLSAFVQCPRDPAKEPMLVVGMVPDSGLLVLRMAMDVVAWRIDDRLVDGTWADVEDSRLLLIDPYDCVPHDVVVAPISWSSVPPN